VYDALTTKRVYKPAFTHGDAKSLILDGTGTQFDPDVVEAFLANEQGFIEIYQSFADTPEEPAPAVPAAPECAPVA
jgi:response regulator RpfG family c-di-GMP phosphodiesterase